MGGVLAAMRHLCRILPFCTLLCGLLAISPKAAAATVHAGNGTTATVEQWTPAKGPPARFVADRYVAWNQRNDGLIIVLGQIEGALWTAQAGARDAVDIGSDLALVQHSADGRAHAFPLVGAEEWEDQFVRAAGKNNRAQVAITSAAIRGLVLQRLWRLASAAWKVSKMRAVAAVATNPYDPNRDDYRRAGSWLVDVTRSGGPHFRYLLERIPTMCWVDYYWRWYVVG